MAKSMSFLYLLISCPHELRRGAWPNQSDNAGNIRAPRIQWWFFRPKKEEKCLFLGPPPRDQLAGALSLALRNDSLYVVTFSAPPARIELEKKKPINTPPN